LFCFVCFSFQDSISVSKSNSQNRFTFIFCFHQFVRRISISTFSIVFTYTPLRPTKYRTNRLYFLASAGEEERLAIEAEDERVAFFSREAEEPPTEPLIFPLGSLEEESPVCFLACPNSVERQRVAKFNEQTVSPKL
jgi:hypothetical protein